MHRDLKVQVPDDNGRGQRLLRFTLVYEHNQVRLRVFEAGRGHSKNAQVSATCSVIWQRVGGEAEDVGIQVHQPKWCLQQPCQTDSVHVFDIVHAAQRLDAEGSENAERMLRTCAGYARVFKWLMPYEFVIVPKPIIERILEHAGMRTIPTHS